MGITSSLQRRLVLFLSRPMFPEGHPYSNNIRVFRFLIPWIVKITQRTTSTEADALRFLYSTRLNLPIPRLIFSFSDQGVTYTIMTRIPGITMNDAMLEELISPDDFECITSEISVVISKLQSLRQPSRDAGKAMMSASGHDMPDGADFFENRAGPFPSTLDCWAHLSGYCDEEHLRTVISEPIVDALKADPARYVHADLRMQNIIVRNGHVSGIIDWEDSGWLPSSWQLYAMRHIRVGCWGRWRDYWIEHRFSDEAEAAYAAGRTFAGRLPV